MRGAGICAAFVSILVLMPAAAARGDSTLPLRPPTGYRNYCDGINKALCPRGGVPQRMWRPFRLPILEEGATCPVSIPRTVTPRIAPVLGPGPVFFAAGAYNPADRSTMSMPFPAPPGSPAAGTGWTLAKAPLVMLKTLRQAVVVRGLRLDGPGELGFSGLGRRPFSALQFPAAWRGTIDLGRHKGYGVHVWASTPGCYGLQVDGATFSRTVIFKIEFSESG